MSPDEDALLDVVFSTFQPPDARGSRSGCLGWPALSELALAVGGVALSRKVYEDVCTFGGVQPGQGFTRGDLGRFYRLPHTQGFHGILRPLRLAYDRVAASGGTARTRDGDTLVVPAGVRAQAYLALASEYVRGAVPAPLPRGDGPRGGKHDWPSVLDHHDDVLGYWTHAANNLDAVAADRIGATCVCCL
jgi:hypothetical protein